MIPDENCYLMWQYCKDPNDIQEAIDNKDKDWDHYIRLSALHMILTTVVMLSFGQRIGV